MIPEWVVDNNTFYPCIILFFLCVCVCVYREIINYMRVYIYTYTYMCACVHAKSILSGPDLCNSVDYSPPGSSTHGVLQARILSGLSRLPP